VTKAAECVPDVYVSDAMENALSPTVLSNWNINTLRSTVWNEKRQIVVRKSVQNTLNSGKELHEHLQAILNLSVLLEASAHSPKSKLLRIHLAVSLHWTDQCALPTGVEHKVLS